MVAPETRIGSTVGEFIVLECVIKSGRKYYKVSCAKRSHEFELRCDSVLESSVCKVCNGNPEYKSGTYNSWSTMLGRCKSERPSDRGKYLDRGISVCSRWSEPGGIGFKNFLEDMGERPEGMTLDRFNNDEGYFKENCRWTSNSEQGYNQRKRTTNKSGRTGVVWEDGRQLWRAYITVQRKSLYLGRFESYEDAVRARSEAEIKYFGREKL